ncbi:TPA_exp: Uncharacterized protein A8136_6167 [Trichophyton benhamiae CBS 112371]|uniref:Uncharacterized protein n=1 Tax=Arthroderma benhamiae (strain ATCC MYA-4681 / CBS 112371) TaxID=663331 RepID=D4AQE9_ARTBC|nr:uncharacterized protein ARB_06456 [Trichophyton benhamiae CBS 112371]EFE34693.1 conserved hypothetical protein [Trichophyton benhamiae CBS 112371]DAA77621.1 TPA_exp: Uncharacterized protein A8136_6167 [Trichophyton benhamiae CBS 112371]
MASEVSVLTVQLPAEAASKQLDTRQFTKLRFPQHHQQHHPQHHPQLRPGDRRNDLLRPSDSSPRSHSPRGDRRHHHDPSAPMTRVRSRENLSSLPTPPGTPTQRYYRPRLQHVQPSKPFPPASVPAALPTPPRPISYSSAGSSQYSDQNASPREPSSTSSSPLSRTPVSASELEHPPCFTNSSAAVRPKSNCSTSNQSTSSSTASASAPKKVEYHTPPLTNSHFSCYHFHKTFARSSNVLYPLTCMTCLKADQEVRWRCTFCCLRICTDCLGGIKRCKDRSLIEFMEKLVMDLEAAGTTTEKGETSPDTVDTEPGPGPGPGPGPEVEDTTPEPPREVPA